MQKFSFSGFGEPVYAKLQINFTSELFLKSIKKNIFMQKFSFSGFGEPVYAKLQINLTSELFLKSITKNIFMLIKLLFDDLELK